MSQVCILHTQFTCFTGTKLLVQQVLWRRYPLRPRGPISLVCSGPQFTCFTSTKVQILTPALAITRLYEPGILQRSSLNLLALLVQKYKYWRRSFTGMLQRCSTQFTCFTSTKVQTLTTRFTSTKVQILTPEDHRHAAEVVQESAGLEVLTLLALLVQKCLLY
jgi:hypothetical protein